MLKVRVYVRLKDTVLDPEGQTIANSLKRLGYEFVNNVRVGKVFDIDIEETENVDEKIKDFCNKLLVNPIIETYEYEIIEEK